MIDIVKAVQEADPSLGTYVVVLRTDARALDGPERFTPEAQAWIAEKAPGGRLARVRTGSRSHASAAASVRSPRRSASIGAAVPVGA